MSGAAWLKLCEAAAAEGMKPWAFAASRPARKSKPTMSRRSVSTEPAPPASEDTPPTEKDNE